MSSNHKRKWLQSAIGAAVGLVCMLMLGAAFYGAMAYQILGGSSEPAPLSDDGALLALPGAQLVSEQTTLEDMGGTSCTVITRVYRTDEGLEVEAVSASPAAYIERLSAENWTAQLVTGFTLAGLDAVCSARGEDILLSARSAERIYMLRAAADEQTLYTLGAGARLE